MCACGHARVLALLVSVFGPIFSIGRCDSLHRCRSHAFSPFLFFFHSRVSAGGNRKRKEKNMKIIKLGKDK